MASLLRILSEADDGTVESRIIPLENITQFRITVKENDTLSAENLVESEAAEETPEATEFATEDKLDESKLTLNFSDATELEIDVLEKKFSFDILDEEGEIVVTTDNLFKLEQGFLISHIISEKAREVRVRALTAKK